MVYKKIKFFLKTNIEKPSIDFKWDNKYNNKLFSFLNEECPNEDLSIDENKDKIKRAFRKYFEPVGYVLLKLKENEIKLKIFPYKIKVEDSINVEPLITILEYNQDCIEYDYNGKEDLISLNTKLKDLLNNFVNDIKNEEINKKDLVKYAIREAFELTERDIIIIRDDRIIIKLLDDASMDNVPYDEQNTIANRYNGINEDDLKSFYDDVFSKNVDEDFFYYAAEIFVNTELLENKIDNLTYETNVFQMLHSIIKEELTNEFDHNEEFFKGFAGYIFRIHFKEVFSYITELILEELSERNDYIYEFLKYYSPDIVVLNGHKYRVPVIESENGSRWTVATMLSIVKVYMRASINLRELEDDIQELNNEVSELSVGGMSPVAYNTSLNKKIDEIKQESNYAARRLDECLGSFVSNGDNAKHKDEVSEIRHNIKRLREEKEKLENSKVSSDIVNEYTDLKREIDSMKRQAHREEIIIEKNSESFNIIKDALTKALTSKKVRIS